MGDDGAVQLTDQVWWVGVRLPTDRFQCHAYFLENGSSSVLIDPGSPLTIQATLDRVRQIAPLDSIAYLVCHHPDPDVAAGLRDLSAALERDDVQVVTEWRAQALLKHYGHRFGYHRVEEHGWTLPLAEGRALEFQLTPYLHFPGAMVSFDTGTRTLFSSDLFGGFVPDSAILVSDDVDYIVEAARPFHQHYMPSTELLSAGLARVQHRWPTIDRIAPQHGHVIPGALVDDAFHALSDIECGVFALADADHDLRHLLQISEAKRQISQALQTVVGPRALVTTMDTILAATDATQDCALFIDLPERGWTRWGLDSPEPVPDTPPVDWPTVELPGEPSATLALRMVADATPDQDLMAMLAALAPTMRSVVDQYLHDYRMSRRVTDLRRAALTDPLTGLGNRRALEMHLPLGDYALISLDIDHFKAVNDTFGHSRGDRVLVEIAGVLQAILRSEDAAYRIGGEEFLIVLPETDIEQAAHAAERVRAAVKALDLTGHAPGGRVTISLGVTHVANGDRSTVSAALDDADAAMYASKQAGRDQVTVRSRR